MGNYPAFDYINGLTEDGGNWYFPAKYELKAVYNIKDSLDARLNVLSKMGISVVLWDTASYWTANFIEGSSSCTLVGRTGKFDRNDHTASLWIRAVKAF